MVKIRVPMGATKSVATLVYPPGFTDEFPSCWYKNNSIKNYINFTIKDIKKGINNVRCI
jgi:hypothetical protein